MELAAIVGHQTHSIYSDIVYLPVTILEVEVITKRDRAALVPYKCLDYDIILVYCPAVVNWVLFSIFLNVS